MTLPLLVLLPALLTAAPPKLAAMDIQVRNGVTPGLAQIVTEALVADLRQRVPQLTGLAAEDLRSVLGFQAQTIRLGCQDTQCLAEIGGALGVDQLLVGSLAKLGRSYILDVRLIDARRGTVLSEANERLEGKAEEDLLGAAQQGVVDPAGQHLYISDSHSQLVWSLTKQ